MTITPQDLRFAGTDGVQAAGMLLGRVAHQLYRQGIAYSRKVLLPVRKKHGWSGAGQPQASVVVAADGLAIHTAASRIRLAANTMQLWATTISACSKAVDTTMTKAEKRDMTVASDGTVTPGDDATDEDEKRARRYTKTLHHELKQARRIDRICTETLRRLCGHKANGHKGYALPVYSTHVGNRLYERSAAAYNQDYTTDWNPYRSRVQLGNGAWLKAIGPLPPCVLGKPGPYRRTGTGFVIGPDMRLYPIALVQSQSQTDGRDGWRTLFTRSGHANFAPDPTHDRQQAGLILLGALAGADYGENRGPSGPLTSRLNPNADAPPNLPSNPGAYPSRGGGYDDPVQLTAVQAANAAADGYARGNQVSARNYYAYTTVFQQDAHGNTRAVIRTYQVSYGPDGAPVVTPTDGYLDKNGEYHQAAYHEPVHFHQPHQYMLPDGTVVTR